MRWILRALISLVILAVLLVGTLFLLPADKIAGLAQEQIRNATGREVTLGGRLVPTVWPQLGVSLGPVALSNASWSQQGPMLQAEKLNVGLDMAALLAGKIQISQLELHSPQILLERAADGRANWELGGPQNTSAPPGTVGETPEFSIERAELRNARLIFTDHTTAQRTEISALDARLALPDFNGVAELTLKGQLNGQSIAGDITLAQAGALLRGQVSGLRTKLRTDTAQLTFDGRAGISPLAADGTLDLDTGALAPLFRLVGQPVPDLPPELAKGVTLKGQTTYAPAGSLHLRDTVITGAGNRVAGSADLTFDGKPRLTGSFNAGALDLSPFMGGAQDSPPSTSGWSDAPIDVSALGALDAEVALAATSVNLGSTQLGPTRLIARLTNRRLVLDLTEVRAHQGLITGEFVINGRGGLSVGGDLTMRGLQTQSLLSDLADYERLLGSGDMRFKFLGVGNNMQAIMNSLQGEGSFALGRGELRGLDLAGMLRRLDMSHEGKGAKTIFDSIGASFTIKEGVLDNLDLALLAPLLKASGAGKVGLGRRTLDYRITPTAFLNDDGDTLKVPLIITGSWANPKFRLDLKALAEQELELERRKQELEERARAEARKAEDRAKAEVAKKLGIDDEDKPDLEDAARDKIEEEAERALKNLFR